MSVQRHVVAAMFAIACKNSACWEHRLLGLNWWQNFQTYQKFIWMPFVQKQSVLMSTWRVTKQNEHQKNHPFIFNCLSGARLIRAAVLSPVLNQRSLQTSGRSLWQKNSSGSAGLLMKAEHVFFLICYLIDFLLCVKMMWDWASTFVKSNKKSL